MSRNFDRAKEYLLPNEEARHVEEIRKGFLVLSNRRLVLLKEQGKLDYRVEQAVPYEAHSEEIQSFVKSLTNQYRQVMEIVDEILASGNPILKHSYLEQMPNSLTHNAVLDLNTVLRDQPIPDRLVHEAEKFLGNSPFLLEESLRDGEDNENGVLFAAGNQGYYWVQGKKSGRFLTNVIIDTVEWANIRNFSHQWPKNGIINVSYSLTQDGNEVSVKYRWCPPTNDETIKYPWLLEPLNGPWIFADVAYRCSGVPILATS